MKPGKSLPYGLRLVRPTLWTPRATVTVHPRERAVDQLLAERVTPELEALRALASRVINQHVDDRGLCAVCGSAFPCERAVLAEHNLALL